MSDQPRLLCPSARCGEGAYLLGVVQRDGTVAVMPDKVQIDSEFVQIARQGRKPEARFRFAGQCYKSACQQWTDNRCGVIDSVLSEVSTSAIPLRAAPGSCAIRNECRWFAQSGGTACSVCPSVITELAEHT